jgi:hypothetical protein
VRGARTLFSVRSVREDFLPYHGRGRVKISCVLNSHTLLLVKSIDRARIGSVACTRGVFIFRARCESEPDIYEVHSCVLIDFVRLAKNTIQRTCVGAYAKINGKNIKAPLENHVIGKQFGRE